MQMHVPCRLCSIPRPLSQTIHLARKEMQHVFAKAESEVLNVELLLRGQDKLSNVSEPQVSHMCGGDRTRRCIWVLL